MNEEVTETGVSASRLMTPLAVTAGIGLCLLYLFAERYLLGGGLGFPLDDSWIHLQFARQLAAGEGLAYNPGRLMTGSTAPLWTALLSLGFLLPGAAEVWAKLLGMAFFGLAVLATDRLAAELDLTPGLRRLALALTVASHWLVWSALSGMEIVLFTSLSLWGMVLHLRERRQPERLPASLPVLAAATLARPEGALLLALATGERLLDVGRRGGGRALAGGLALALLVLAPALVFYRVVGGSFLPTTFAVKASAPVDLLPSGRYLAAVLSVFFGAQPLMLLVAGAGALRLAERLGGERDRGLLPAAWLLGLPLAYAFLTGDRGPILVGNFGRYLFPLLPVLVVLGVLGLEPLGRRLRGTAGRALLVTLLLVPQVWGVVRGASRYAQTVANVEDSDVRAAHWLAERLDPEAVLAVQDIGALKYFLPNRVVDLTGIVNPEILPYLRDGGADDPVYWEERLLQYLAGERPDYLVVFPNAYPRITGRTPGFRKVQSFIVPQNVTMAGDELAVYATPWTRFPLPVGGSG